MRTSRLLFSLVATTAVVATSGCAGASHESAAGTRINDLPGKPIQVVDSEIPSSTKLYVLDVSPVVGLQPTYNGSQQSSDRWIILAACADKETVKESSKIEVSVIPIEKKTDSLVEKATQGKFKDTVNCKF